jgi:hypothetical protein
MRSKTGNLIPHLPQVHVSQTVLVLLLILCTGVALYSYYRLRGGKSFGSLIRKKFRRCARRRANGRYQI